METHAPSPTPTPPVTPTSTITDILLIVVIPLVIIILWALRTYLPPMTERKRNFVRVSLILTIIIFIVAVMVLFSITVTKKVGKSNVADKDLLDYVFCIPYAVLVVLLIASTDNPQEIEHIISSDAMKLGMTALSSLNVMSINDTSTLITGAASRLVLIALRFTVVSVLVQKRRMNEIIYATLSGIIVSWMTCYFKVYRTGYDTDTIILRSRLCIFLVYYIMGLIALPKFLPWDIEAVAAEVGVGAHVEEGGQGEVRGLVAAEVGVGAHVEEGGQGGVRGLVVAEVGVGAHVEEGGQGGVRGLIAAEVGVGAHVEEGGQGGVRGLVAAEVGVRGLDIDEALVRAS
ncbi:hypothetical protein ACFE04_031228 [Oxalis oulophora]